MGNASSGGLAYTPGGAGGGGVAISPAGNTAGVTSLVSSGTLFLAGGNNVTLSQNGASITISANTAAAANLSVSAGTTTGAFGGLTFSNGSNVSFGLNNGTITASVLAQSVQTQASGAIAGSGVTTTTQAGSTLGVTHNTAGLSLAIPLWLTTAAAGGIDLTLGGNTAGVLALVSTGTLFLAGGNNVTLSQNGQSVTISGANAGGAQTGISGIQVSNTTYTSGTVTWQNANGLSFGSSGANGISGSYTVPSQVSLFALGNTTQNSSTVLPFNALSFQGLGEATVGFSNGSIQISNPPSSVGVSTGGNTSGNTGAYSGQVVLAGGNNVTLSVSSGANGAQTITISGANAGGAQTGISGIQVSNTTYSAGTVTFQNANGISFGSSGANGISASYTVPTQTAQTEAIFIAGNSTAQSSQSTYTVGSLNISAAGLVSIGWSSNSLIFSAPATTGFTQFSGGMSTGGNTSGNTGIASNQLVLAGGNNVTLSGSTNGGSMTITISAANAGGAQTGISGLQVSNTTYTSGTVTLQNANGISFGSSGANGISASYTVPTVISTAGLFALGNTTQNSSTALNLSALSFNGLGAQTVGFSNGSIQLSVPVTSSLSATGFASLSINGSTISIGAAIPQLSFFQPLGPVLNTTVTQNGIGSVQVYPAAHVYPFTATRVDMMASVSAAILAASTEAQTLSMFVGLYSLNGSTLSLASSGSQSYAWTNSSGNSSASITGLRRFSAPINVNYTGGFDLFIGVMSNTTFVNTNGISLSNVVVPLGPGPQLQGLIGEVAANSKQFVPGQGFFSTTSIGMPSSMALSAISGAGSGGNAVDNYVPVQFANVTA